MRNLINIIFSLLLGIIFTQLGYPFYTWQFWVFGIPIIIIYKIIEEQLFKKTKNQ